MEKEVKTKEKKTAKVKKTENKTDTSKVYEISYILASTIQDEKVSDEVSTISKLITSNGGDVISSENPVLIELAYPMVKITPTFRGKFSKGYFGWMKFEMEPEFLSKIKENLDISNNVVRYLIIKTVRENTLLNGKMVLKNDLKKPNDEIVSEDDVVLQDTDKPINLEEVDKAVDDLVIV